MVTILEVNNNKLYQTISFVLCTLTSKDKLISIQPIKSYRESGDIAPLIPRQDWNEGLDSISDHRTPLRNPFYKKMCGLQRGLSCVQKTKNTLLFLKIESRIVQPIVWPLNLLSYSGLSVHSHTLLSVCVGLQTTQKRPLPPKLLRHLHERRMAPQRQASATFFIYIPAGIPPPPGPSLPYQLMLSSLISYNYFTSSFFFVSSFPHFKKWKNLFFRNKETSGLGLEGQFFRTWQIPVGPSARSCVFRNTVHSNE